LGFKAHEVACVRSTTGYTLRVTGKLATRVSQPSWNFVESKCATIGQPTVAHTFLHTTNVARPVKQPAPIQRATPFLEVFSFEGGRRSTKVIAAPECSLLVAPAFLYDSARRTDATRFT
jgi:hypothetical protein